MKRRKGFYSISVVAKMFSVHQQTIRMYEKEGLISPKRTEGNTRLFSEEDVDRLEEIINLTHKMGVNLAGVQMILKLQKKIQKLQGEMNHLFDQVKSNLESEGEKYKSDFKKQGQKLVDMKIDNKNKTKDQGPIDIKEEAAFDLNNKKEQDQSSDGQAQDLEEFDDWEIEYEESD